MSSSRRTPPVTTHEWLAESDAEHIASIRADPSRYSVGGLIHLVLEVLAYPVDEAESGTTDRVLVTLHADGSISIEDNGRGTNVFFDETGQAVVKPIMATRDLRFFEIPEAPLLPDGLKRSGMSVVAAMSGWLVHTNRRVDGAWTRRYEHGLPESGLVELPEAESANETSVAEDAGAAPTDTASTGAARTDTAFTGAARTGTRVHFRPDPAVFGDAVVTVAELQPLCAQFVTTADIQVVSS
jgi:DNA gyrase subunit B